MSSPSNSNCLESPMAPSMVEHSPSVAASNPGCHSRSRSVDSSQDNKKKESHSYKRAEEPPRNEDGKIVCKHQECHGTSFKRKCDWNKHMDKHDRPYKCDAKGCEKLEGFTYSGGLLRHEREVHKMHGSAKKIVFCPFPDCKRSSGSGFARKENLAEHIRRIHRRTSVSANPHGLLVPAGTGHREMEGSPTRTSCTSESPYNRSMDCRDDEDTSLKRKRRVSESEVAGHRDDDEMQSKNKRLEKENEEQAALIKKLEQELAVLQRKACT